MVSRFAVAAITVAYLLVAPAGAAAKPHGNFTPGAPGIGDPYFPLDGNGGYDVAHYLLDFRYDPAVGVLDARETIRARATQNLSSFNLDFHTLDIDTIYVDGRSATWSRDGDELTVTPRRPLHKGERFTTVLFYDGVPDSLPDGPGWLQTDDGVLVAGQPHGPSTYFAVNDHPLDKASYTFRITVPSGVEAVANGLLRSRRTHRGWTTWVWDAKEPMASYLATVDIGQFDLRFSRAGRVRIIDAVDPDLYNRVQPRTGSQFALSQSANLSYKRLTHVINVPAAGANMSFWVTRDTELNWDFFFVEAHTVGADDWTTLPDVNGHTGTDTGFVCPLSLELHPFLAHYETDNGDGTCSATGTTGGTWNAVSGQSDGYEQWKVDLSAYAGKQVEVSLGYASDDIFNFGGVFVDDVEVSTGEGTTSFEDDGNPLDGWTVPGAPPDSAPNDNDWIVGTEADQPETTGEIADAALAKQPAIIAFLEGLYGRYPWQSSGAIIDDMPGLGFALETQGRPVYAFDFFADRPEAEEADSVIVHELAHQWVGDSLAVAAWRHIWLNEGFATYTEWLYGEEQGRGSAQDQFDFFAAAIPADDPFWQVVIGDPGPDQVLDIAIYWRGAMTLHALRGRIGDDAFFKLLRTWTTRNAGRNVTIPEFIALAERISRQDLGAFFDEWLFTAGKPASLGAAARASRTVASSLRSEAAARLRAFAHARP
jgi:peptidase M1-like protein/immune inhibitor InhA-like protein